MSRRLQQLILFCFIAMLASASAAERTHDLGIAWEEGRMTVTYVVEPNLSTELQASANLVEWGPAEVQGETVSQQPDGTRIVKAVVSAVGPGMFFQLRRAPASQLTIAWDPAYDSTVAGYTIRLRRRGDVGMRRIDAGYATTATLILPADGGLYSFDVISYTAEGVESEPSNAIAITVGT
jgi:hypothetical protein